MRISQITIMIVFIFVSDSVLSKEVNCFNPLLTKPVDELTTEVKVILENICNLSSDISNFQTQDGLTDQWAQEYTGSDLVRQLLSENKLASNVGDNLVHVLDHSMLQHGEHVSNLIAGPHPSATIPGIRSGEYSSTEGSHFSAWTEYVTKNQERQTFPGYLNISMEWLDDNSILESVKKISNSGTLVVTAAGNFSETIQKVKEQAASELNVIVVAQLSPSGLPFNASSFSEQVTISAPGDELTLSYSASGEPHAFG